MTNLKTSIPQISAFQHSMTSTLPGHLQNSPEPAACAGAGVRQTSSAAVAAVAKPASSCDDRRSVEQPRTTARPVPMELIRLPSGLSVYRPLSPERDRSVHRQNGLRPACCGNRSAETTAYGNHAGTSGVRGYDFGEGWIEVTFAGGGVYRYTDRSAGRSRIAEMQRLAHDGQGLNGYINRHARTRFESRVR